MPLLYRKEGPGESLMAVWKITETEEILRSMLHFSDVLEGQLARISCIAKRLEWLASRILVQELSGCCASVTYNVNGKPALIEKSSGISISHTKGYAAVVVSHHDRAGVDIEYPSARISKVADRFLHPSEESYIVASYMEIYHALIWCAKETLYKRADIPGLNFKEDLIIEPFEPSSVGSMNGLIKVHNKWVNVRLEYTVTPDYYLVWHW
jgi:4'-phosphopantetheinyl transferase